MGEHRALGNAGCAAGILQHGDIFMRIDDDSLRFAVVFDQVVKPDTALRIVDPARFPAPETGKQKILRKRQLIGKTAKNNFF